MKFPNNENAIEQNLETEFPNGTNVSQKYIETYRPPSRFENNNNFGQNDYYNKDAIDAKLDYINQNIDNKVKAINKFVELIKNDVNTDVNSIIKDYKLEVSENKNKKYEKWFFAIGGAIIGAIISNLSEIIKLLPGN